MKKLYTLLLALSLSVSLIACGPTVVPYDEEITQAIEANQAHLIDVRSEEEYKTGHIPKAINIPLDKLDSIEEKIKDKQTPIYVYCRAGNRSHNAQKALIEKGYTNVSNLGGISNYTGDLEK